MSIVVLCLGVWLRAALGPILAPDGPPARSGSDPMFPKRRRFASLMLFLSQTCARILACVPKICKLMYLKFRGVKRGPPSSDGRPEQPHQGPTRHRRPPVVGLSLFLLLAS